MSRVGLLPIPIPQGVEVKIESNRVTIKGVKGELSRYVHPGISATLKDGSLVVTRSSDDRIYRALHGLTRSLLANMVEGVTKGFRKSLELSGVGYRAQKVDDKLVLRVGYSHPVEFVPPPGITIELEGTNRIHVTGIDKEKVGEVVARIRAVRRTDAYKGKGIKYVGEKLRLKPGKAGRAMGAK